MSQPNVLVPRQPLEAQPFDVRGLTPAQRDALIVSALEVDGQWVIVSRYGDENWKIVGQATNKQLSEGYADFALLPVAFRPVMKAILYRYMRRGREGKKRPSPRSIVKLLRDSRRFLQYLDRLNIVRLADVTPIVCAAYAQACKEHRQSARAT